MSERVFNLKMVPEKSNLGWKSFNFASTLTDVAAVRGSAITSGYTLQAIQFLKSITDAAKANLQWLPVVRQETLPTGHKDMIIPKRKTYMPAGDWEASREEYDIEGGTYPAITWTDITTAEGVQFTPVRYNYGVALSNLAIQQSAINQVAYCREELAYRYSDHIDSLIRNAICGTWVTDAQQGGGTDPTEPTPMSNTVNAAQTIFGGDKTNTADALNAGDILTVGMIKKAIRLMSSDIGYYWTGNVFTKSAKAKNPWTSAPAEPLVLFIAPEQWANLMEDTQFTNAAEFGGREAVLNGEVAKYLGVRIVVTTKVPAIADAGYVRVQAANVSTDVNGHICALVKAQKAAGLVWGQEARFKTFDWPNADQVRMQLSLAAHTQAIHPDAIVRMIVSDE